MFGGVLRTFCGRIAGGLRAVCERFAGGLRVDCGWWFAGGLRADCGWRFAGGLRADCGWRFASGMQAVSFQFAVGGLRLRNPLRTGRRSRGPISLILRGHAFLQPSTKW